MVAVRFGVEVGEHGEHEGFIVDFCGWGCLIFWLAGEPFVDGVLGLFALAEVVVAVFFGDVAVELLHWLVEAEAGCIGC